MNVPQIAIVVAVGLDSADAALKFAAAEAVSTSRPLHLVHVLEVPTGRGYAYIGRSALETAESKLAELREEALELTKHEIPVSTEVLDQGWVVDDLARGARAASLVVLQHNSHGPLQRFVTGSVVKGVAGRAVMPVVSVPAGWTPPERPALVTAAVQDPAEAGLVLGAAFAEAERQHTALVVLHAWWLASGYDVVVADDAMRERLASDFRDEIAPAIVRLRRQFPSVDVTVQVRHAPPVEAVLDAAEQSDLVVIGRRHRLLPLGSHLGPVARRTIEQSAAPVLITPEPETHPPSMDANGRLASAGR